MTSGAELSGATTQPSDSGGVLIVTVDAARMLNTPRRPKPEHHPPSGSGLDGTLALALEADTEGRRECIERRIPMPVCHQSS